MAVRHDVGALGQTDEITHLDRAAALENALEREVDGAGDVTVPGIAVRTGGSVELERRANVEQRHPLPGEKPTQLVERHLLHWLTNSSRTSLKRSG